MTFERLKETVEQIVLTEEAGKRILDLEKKKRKRDQRKKTVKRSLAAACMAAFLILGFSFFPKGSCRPPEWNITVYAKEADQTQWLSLKPGARVLLELLPEKERYCMKLDLPDHYYYEKQSVTLGQDTIFFEGKTIYWLPCKEETGLPEVMTTSMYIKILDENRREVDRVILEMTREYGSCYVQIKKEEEL